MIDWNNTKDVVKRLEETFPDEDIINIDEFDLKEFIGALTEYDNLPPEMNLETLALILDSWRYYRENP